MRTINEEIAFRRGLTERAVRALPADHALFREVLVAVYQGAVTPGHVGMHLDVDLMAVKKLVSTLVTRGFLKRRKTSRCGTFAITAKGLIAAEAALGHAAPRGAASLSS